MSIHVKWGRSDLNRESTNYEFVESMFPLCFAYHHVMNLLTLFMVLQADWCHLLVSNSWCQTYLSVFGEAVIFCQSDLA